METKKQIIKTAKVCYIVTKVLYILSYVACTVFIALTIAMSCIAESGVLFGTLALRAFMCIGLLWNVEGIFKSVGDEQAPFGERVSHYLEKTAIFLILISVVPSLAGSVLLRILCQSTELVFPIEFGGIVAGVVLFLFGMFFKYGKELQKSEDETL